MGEHGGHQQLYFLRNIYITPYILTQIFHGKLYKIIDEVERYQTYW
jgi:hypothetical protein